MAKRIIAGDGIPCPRCGRPTQIREHKAVKPKQLRQPFYYARWFYCLHEDCQTRQIMRDEDMVWNDNEAARWLKAHSWQAPRAPPEPRAGHGDVALEVLDCISRESDTSTPPWE